MPRRLDPEKGIPGLFARGRSKSQDMAFLVEDARTPKPRRGGSKGRSRGERPSDEPPAPVTPPAPIAAPPASSTALVLVAARPRASGRRVVPVTVVPARAVDVPVAVTPTPRIVVPVAAVAAEEHVVPVSLAESPPAHEGTEWTRESQAPEVARLLRAIRRPREAPLALGEIPSLLACAGAWLATTAWGLLGARR